MNPKKTFILVGYSKGKYVVEMSRYLKSEGIDLVCAYEREANTEGKQKALVRFAQTYNLSDPEQLQALSELEDVVGITCTQERDMPTYLKTLLLKGFISPEQNFLYQSLIDKDLFKRTLTVENPELIPQHHIVNDELINNLDSLQYPQVIKPTGLAGSSLVKIVNSKAEFLNHYNACAERIYESGRTFYQKDISIITEEFIDGPQYSVNLYINKNGDFTMCPIIRVITPSEFGINDSYSALQYPTTELSIADLDKLQAALKTVIRTFKIANTSAHFDCVLQDGQWKFFEVGLRIGGNRQEIYGYSHGFSHIKNDLKNRLWQEITLPPQTKEVCLVQKAAVSCGVLRSVSYSRTVTAEKAPLITEGKINKLGLDVSPVSDGGATITSHYVQGKELQEVLDTSVTLFKDITFSIETESESI